MAISLKDLDSNEASDWCPGCGDAGILLSVKKTIINLNLDPHNVVIVSGIGCSSKLPHFIKANGVHTLHGRAIPFAEGIKIANPDLTVIIDSGDGDTYGIGVGHFISAARRNVDIKLFIHDNGVYALTKGQSSPTLPENTKVKGIAEPNINSPINPLLLAINAGYTFVARGQSYNVNELTDLMTKAINHKGLAMIDIMQGCPTYNEVYTSSQWFSQHIEPLPSDFDPVVHDPSNQNEVKEKRLQAIRMLMDETPEHMHSGLFFQWENPDTFEKRLLERGLEPPIKQKIADESGRSTADMSKVIEALKV